MGSPQITVKKDSGRNLYPVKPLAPKGFLGQRSGKKPSGPKANVPRQPHENPLIPNAHPYRKMGTLGDSKNPLKSLTSSGYSKSPKKL